MADLLYTLYPAKQNKDEIIDLLKANPQIKFASLVAVDLGNNHTDEKIPIEVVLEDYDHFMVQGMQTDGSSVYLPEIAEINNAKVDLIPDLEVRWLIDYNEGHIDVATGKPVGTLIIPAFLQHDKVFVDSRSVLKKAEACFTESLKALFDTHPEAWAHLGLDPSEKVKEAVLTTATELEFWVKTPDYTTDIEKLSTSQSLKEQYWKRTVGPVRTALEKSVLALNHYDFEAEMGHKEVGGVPAKLKKANNFSHVMEQLEIDWKYDHAMQSADNELFARDIIGDIFVKEGLEVTFRAKPIEGVAGSGEHHHIGVGLRTESGKYVNLFAPTDMASDYLNPFGYGAFMGVLNNYEVINPFVTSTNDAFNRLKPGFEAPVCIVGSLGHTVEEPSRNRTVLMGLVRDMTSPYATRFELRAPNPTSNTYLLSAACYQAMLDGIHYAITNKKTGSELLAELRKPAGQTADYLADDRQYTSEDDVFEHYTQDERNKLFSTPPKNVYENVLGFDNNPNKLSVLSRCDVFTPAILSSYRASLLLQWKTELGNRIVPENADLVRSFTCLHKLEEESITDVDVVRWEAINALRKSLMKDSLNQKSIFTQIRDAIAADDYKTLSDLQNDMALKTVNLKVLFSDYKQNLFVL